MKILVTGATGFVGREVLRQLQAAGHTARIIARTPQAAAAQLPQPSCVKEFHQGDVTDPASLKDAAMGCDAVIHLVGIISEFAQVTFDRLHPDATRNVIIVAQAAGVRRFVHMSALGTRPNAPARYHQTKWAAEEEVQQSDLDHTILRPSVIYGPEDHFVNLFVQMSRWSPFLPTIGSGTALLQPVSVHLVAQCFVQALTQPQSIGRTLDVCGPERLTTLDLLRTLLSVMKRRRWILPIPLPLARVQAMLLEGFVGSVLHKPPPLTRDQLLMLQEDNVGNPQPAEQLFNLEQTGFEQGIREYVIQEV